MVTASSRSRDAVVIHEQLLGELESRIEGPARQFAAGTRSIWEVPELDLDVALLTAYLPGGSQLISRRSTRLARTREQAHGAKYGRGRPARASARSRWV